MSSACTCHIDVNSCSWCKLQRIKFQTKLSFDIATKNVHVLNEKDYIKLNTFVSYEDLFWLIEQAERAERMEMMYENTGSIMNRRHQINKIERYEKALRKIVEMESPFYHRETQSETPYNYARVALEDRE